MAKELRKIRSGLRNSFFVSFFLFKLPRAFQLRIKKTYDSTHTNRKTNITLTDIEKYKSFWQRYPTISAYEKRKEITIPVIFFLSKKVLTDIS